MIMYNMEMSYQLPEMLPHFHHNPPRKDIILGASESFSLKDH
jgi:hypothetical protein